MESKTFVFNGYEISLRLRDHKYFVKNILTNEVIEPALISSVTQIVNNSNKFNADYAISIMKPETREKYGSLRDSKINSSG